MADLPKVVDMIHGRLWETRPYSQNKARFRGTNLALLPGRLLSLIIPRKFRRPNMHSSW